VIELPFDPMVALGPLTLTWHAVFGLLGVLAGAALGIRLVLARISFDDAWAVAIGGVLGGLAGSRLFFVVEHLAPFLAHPERALAVGDGGESIVGGIVGGLTGGLLMMRARRLPVAWVVDRGVVGLPLGMAIGRLGDVVNGEHWATACGGLPWCVRYTHPASLGQREYVHPAVAYELLLDLAIVGVLLAFLQLPRVRATVSRATDDGASARDGFVPLLFLGLYGAGRLALSAVRLDPLWIAGLTQAQLVSALFVAVALAGIARLRRAESEESHRFPVPW